MGDTFEKFTKPVPGQVNYTFPVPATAQTLEDIGVVINSKTKLIRISFDGDPGTIVARFRDGGQDPDAVNGDPLYGADIGKVSGFQFDNLKLIAVGTPVNMHIRQYMSGNLFNL